MCKGYEKYISELKKNDESPNYRRKSTKRKRSENDYTETYMYNCENDIKGYKETI